MWAYCANSGKMAISICKVKSENHILSVSDLDWHNDSASYLTPEEVKIFVTQDNVHAFLAKDGKESVGAVIFSEEATYCEILLVCVKDTHRLRGIGRRLMKKLPEKLISYTVHEKFIQNCGFLVKLGFQPNGPVNEQKDIHFNFYKNSNQLEKSVVTK